MNKISVIRVLSITGLMLAASMLVPAVAALVVGEREQLFAFSVTAVATGVLSGSVYLLTPKTARRSTPVDALAVVIVWWFLAPVAAAPPFVIGVANADIGAALHEAISCLTTTGYSVIEIGETGWPVSLVLWRGVLHLFGAVASIIMAASVFAALNLGGPGVHRTALFTIPDKSYFTVIPRVAMIVASIVGVMTVTVFALLLATGMPVDTAMSDAVSVVTTGLVNPDALTNIETQPIRRIILAFGLIVSTLGLAVWLMIRSGRLDRVIADPELLTFLACMAGFTLFVFLDGTTLLDGLAWSLSSLSTSGLPLTSTPVQNELPAGLVVIPVLIGGSALSSAGGFKLGRFLILMRRALLEFSRLGFRGAIVSLKFRGRVQQETTVIGIWVYFIAYLLAITLIMSLLSFSGLEFRSVLLSAVGALSNAGQLVDPALTGQGSGAVLMFSMILGRLEVLALLPAFLPGFWRR